MISTMFSLWLFFLFPLPLRCACILNRQGVSGYVEEGDITLWGMFPLHLDPGASLQTFTEPPNSAPCKRFSFRSYRWVLAMMFAIVELNRTPQILPNLTWGVGVLDTCSSASRALEGAAWLLSGAPAGTLSHHCRRSSQLTAVLADSGADSVLSVAKVLGLYRYPQVSYFIPPPELSNRVLFPTSLSVAPALTAQARGLIRLLQFFGWSWVGVLVQEGSVSTVAQTFLKELEGSGICVAFNENVPSVSVDVSKIVSVVRRSTATVVVVFSLEAYLNPVLLDLALKGDSRPRIWLTTEGWSTSPGLVAPWLSQFLHGTLGLVLRNGAAPGFKEFVFGLQPSILHKDPFLIEFWEEAFGCHWDASADTSSFNPNLTVSSISASTTPTFSFITSSSTHKVLCTGKEEPASLQLFSDIGDLRVTYNVYKSVRMIYGALRDMAMCKEGEGPLSGGRCVNISDFKPWQFHYYLRRVHTKGNIGDDLYFDPSGNAPAVYDIINWQTAPSGGFSWAMVGSYESGATHGKDMLINDNFIQWREDIKKSPSSVCSEHCTTGLRKAIRQGQPSCCFDCVPCSSGEISNQTDSVECFLCSDDEWPNSARNQCLPRAIELLSLSEPFGLSLGATSVIGSLLPAAVLVVFISNRDTPLVRANNRGLSILLLAALLLSFLCPLLLLLPPGSILCFIRQATFGILFALCISCLLAKTVIVVLAFRANQLSKSIRVIMGPHSPILIALFCTVFQLILCLSWIIKSPPFPEQDTKSQVGIITIKCNEGLGFWFMLGYLGLLSTICFVVAFLARKLPGAFNEATHITFSMVVFLCVWVSFVPAYLSTHGKLAVATEIFAILSSSAGLLFCIFSPKCYIILLKPQLNTRVLVSSHQRRRPGSH
ncbi:hypothetical protein XELAEV_18019313mg [Xenopus laevis]|uniref:G-protein coupled receptors family 3 profile domain-containing protein n=1 Tax=Xenopus laevis TaxID=8355 RepID=A0A974DGX5_XENLA|nr:hypothetical protein XELAEV_18019313mg [Xenopus laevis]